MLVTRPKGFGFRVWRWQGSALRQVWPLVLALGANALLVDLLYERWGLDTDYSLTLAPFSLVGLALGIFLGFRNNACYDRYWEARKHWGALVNNSRSFARAVLLYTRDEDGLQRRLIYRQAAFVHALRMHLRGETDWGAQLGAFLGDEELDALPAEPNVPNAILLRLGRELDHAWSGGRVDTFHLPALEACVTADTDVQGACERIKNTPLPASYTILTHRIVGLYGLLLPFGLHGEVGYLTPIVTMFVGYAFIGLDAIGTEIEDPFGTDPNDLPLRQLSVLIERDLRRSLGEDALPDAVQAVQGVVT
jgi:putative membrane protein